MEQETKKCPYCGEAIMATAKKCKHCGEWFDTSLSNEGAISNQNAFNTSGVNEKTNSFVKRILFVICSVVVSFFVIILLINTCIDLAFGSGDAIAPSEDLINELKKYDISLGEQKYETGTYKIQVTSASNSYDLSFKLLVKCEDGSSQYEDLYSDNEDIIGIKTGQTVWFSESIDTEGDVVSVQIVDAYIDGESVLKNAKGMGISSTENDENASNGNTDTDSDYAYKLTGILGTIEIVMFLNIDNFDDITGYYSFLDDNGVRKRIGFVGKYREDPNIESDKHYVCLVCDDSNDFEGFFDDGTYSGTFTTTKREKFDFILEIENNNDN